MKDPDQSARNNDYAVAKTLNDSVISIFSIISFYQILGPLKEFGSDELHRAYLFLVDELEQLYDRNPKLKEIEPEPTWRQFDIIKDKIHLIQKYIEEHDTGHDHTIRVEKLCILSGQETPELSLKQQKIINETKNIYDKYMKLLLNELTKIQAEKPPEDKEVDIRDQRFWCIDEYTVTYKPDGTILVNNTFKLKKIHAGSTVERLLEQSSVNPNKLFKPDIGQTARNLSTVLSSAGFNPTLRALFFPIVSDDKGVIFRPKVSRNQVLEERIDTYELDTILAKAGAQLAVRPEDELVAIGLAAPSDD